MSLTEREKEIALECFWLFEGRTGSEHGINAMFNEFLSSIREEQEAVAYKCGGCGRLAGSVEEDWNTLKMGGFRSCCPERNMQPLFTIPPASQDCSKLVEALERICNAVDILGDCEGGQDGRVYLENIAGDALKLLSNHAKRMKGE